MSKLIIFLCVVYFATADATFSQIVQHARSLCVNRANHKIDAEKELVQRKYDFLGNIRDRISSSYQQVAETVLKPATEAINNAIEKVNEKATSLTLDIDPSNECINLINDFVGKLENILHNFDACRTKTDEKNSELYKEIEKIRDDSLKGLDSLKAANGDLCIETYVKRARAFARTLVTLPRLTLASTKITMRQLISGFDFPKCIREQGYDAFQNVGLKQLREIEQCVDDKVANSISGGLPARKPTASADTAFKPFDFHNF